ncbi:hypothetical protein MVEN_00784600 [Mycena venus]|uniref:Uncharacterized protein n=1 Tax=Mycena venus TaxID=2733690 RepID=A0A8H7D6D2_9AGAR|nr:hypothetical protein MVEN_00784600 [Mycena venus]
MVGTEPSAVPAFKGSCCAVCCPFYSTLRRAVGIRTLTPYGTVSAWKGCLPLQSYKRVSAAEQGGAETPTRQCFTFPDLNQEEAQIKLLHAARLVLPTIPRLLWDQISSILTSMTWICVLLQQENDPSEHEVFKALRKAIRQRVKRLSMKHDNESIK